MDGRMGRKDIRGNEMKRTFRIPLRVVFYREDGRWVAHCLEFDLCGDGASKVEALKSLSQSITLQVRASIEHDSDQNLFSPAPGEIQERFFAGQHVAEGELQLELGTERLDHFEIEGTECREYSEDSDLVEA